ncbi:hypothetical protein NJB14197_07650 [Mycobacterium montefiorense]|uniref:Uncharacterized protein n=1 Tax=Mycobacterium montefiorense TaxID=154654 RepID=A0AA37PKH4_9MYCO|nr:hypothetical protein MmonteBS_35280 [Mycobacterium montefiorense]GKU37371.1 hypothetical protein NJB14191_47170 [Mycobacterium montefiorense]GKU42019.1 hypothetical protein NJB14192_40020 [Mycobacterium montefiorense]GKU45519.1 hypothetical protein NJB14194_21400 [Mycobacterium montefiorense]GKU53519.1 hypothetical protein NJB14195_47600 [Mycobacterium montefiorense]
MRKIAIYRSGARNVAGSRVGIDLANQDAAAANRDGSHYAWHSILVSNSTIPLAADCRNRWAPRAKAQGIRRLVQRFGIDSALRGKESPRAMEALTIWKSLQKAMSR